MRFYLILGVQKLIYLFSPILLLFAYQASAQILDDSTKNVYGPETTLFFQESQIKYNQGSPSTIDTSLFNLQRSIMCSVMTTLCRTLAIWGQPSDPFSSLYLIQWAGSLACAVIVLTSGVLKLSSIMIPSRHFQGSIMS